ncbi:TonB family protein [Ideonella sp. B7]|uniref:TonB family protein n=1 Tax=Ideonella benzenivorans TaxID=2831643 RepID=UPI002872B468|nr:TonB family protein [Ideonella benzenivorans]MCA6218524.1 TonB family protein [Ideonella benzenivorans]
MNPLAPSRWGWAQGLGGSLLLHGALLLLGLWGTGRVAAPVPPPRHHALVLDLAGLVGTRQVEAQAGPRHAHPPAPPRPAAPRVAQAPRPTPPAPSPGAQRPLPRHPTPAVAEPPAPSPMVAPVGAQAPVTPGPDATPPHAAAEARAAQTIRPRPQDEAAAIQQYLRALRQAIQSRLVYPPEARAAGVVGAPVIRFAITASGEIQPGSLALQESSGHPVLDERALAAALASAPLARPPKPMKVAIAVSFTRDP